MTLRPAILVAALIACLGQTASAGDAECNFQMGGREVLVGPCQASDKDAAGAFSINSPDTTIAARLTTKGGGAGKLFWNDGIKGREAETLIGPVVLVGACWVSDKAKLCVTR